jgi:hypothetical protein
MPAAEATKLLTRHQWHEGDVALLQAAATRLRCYLPMTNSLWFAAGCQGEAGCGHSALASPRPSKSVPPSACRRAKRPVC